MRKWIFMGNNESAPKLDEDISELSLQSEDLEMLPYNIRYAHPIRTLLLAHNRLIIIPARLDNLECLDISYNELGKMPLDKIVVDYPNLKQLSISGNSIKSLPYILSSFECLSEITADRNEIEDGDFDFTKLVKLQYLDLFLNQLKVLPKLPQSLLSLNIGYNNITSISAVLSNLTELRLPGNCISHISQDTKFQSLKTLDLSFNKLSNISKILEMAPNLQTLDLSFNFLTTFPLQFPISIIKINVSNNLIESMEESLINLTNLTHLNISSNKITRLPLLPPNLINLYGNENSIYVSEYISLVHNNQLQLDHNMFTEIPQINCVATNVSIKYNNVSTVEAEKFGPSINSIDLTGNLISELPLGIFLIERLQTLNLTANKIKVLPDGLETSKITSLYISENPISALPALPLSLITLYSIGCEFTEIPNSVFSCTRLAWLNMSNNNISNIEKIPKVSRLSLSCNKFRQIPAIPESVTFLDISHNQIQNLSIRGEFIMIQELDASYNSISEFTHDPLPVLHTLKLSHNPAAYVFDPILLPSLRMADFVGTRVSFPSKIPERIGCLLTSDDSLFKRAQHPRVRLVQEGARCGYSETVGTRPSMEDAMVVRADDGLFAVMDGHGGSDTAAIAAFFLPQYLAQEAAPAAAVRRLNERLRRQKVRDGATLCLVSVSRGSVAIAHLGDTRALLVSAGGRHRQLTADHRPAARAEMELLKARGSFVAERRTAGVLAVSRALGDFAVEGLAREPELAAAPLGPSDECLVIACDGVFDVLPNEVVARIAAAETDPALAAAKIRNTATGRLSNDNISVIVVRFH